MIFRGNQPPQPPPPFYMCTVAEQGEDMQGYVTELILTLEAVVENLDSDFRPMDIMRVN